MHLYETILVVSSKHQYFRDVNSTLLKSIVPRTQTDRFKQFYSKLTFGRRLMGVVKFLFAVQRPGKVFVYHGGHVASVMGENHAVDGQVLRVCGVTPVPRSRVVHVVLVLVHFSTNV